MAMNEEVPMMLFDSDMEDEGRILIFLLVLLIHLFVV